MSARRAAQEAPAVFIAPMKARGSKALPTGVWRCEIMFQGYRCIAVVNGGTVELWSRTRKSKTADFPGIVSQLRRLKCRDAVIDGEIVGFDAKGRSRLQPVQNHGAKGASVGIAYFAFDLMRLDGELLLARSLEDRSGLLRSLIRGRTPQVQFSSVFETEPSELFAEARKNGLEGIIAKKPGSHYEPDRRSGAWLKCKVRAEQGFDRGHRTSRTSTTLVGVPTTRRREERRT